MAELLKNICLCKMATRKGRVTMITQKRDIFLIYKNVLENSTKITFKNDVALYVLFLLTHTHDITSMKLLQT